MSLPVAGTRVVGAGVGGNHRDVRNGRVEVIEVNIFVRGFTLDFGLLRGTIGNNRTPIYGEHKNLCHSVFLLTIFGPIYYGPH